MSESRRDRRYLLRKGETKWKEQLYADNLGNEYRYKRVAQLSSFVNIVNGCFRNGFPITLKWLWYNAWAFYPFFFVKATLPSKGAIPMLNHERIHIRQQRDIHLTISLPLLVLCLILEVTGEFNPLPYLLMIPFIPTFLYGLDMLRVFIRAIRSPYKDKLLPKVTFNEVRKLTCFELEANSHQNNTEYIATRKFWAVLAYTGLKCFSNYGTNQTDTRK